STGLHGAPCKKRLCSLFDAQASFGSAPAIPIPASGGSSRGPRERSALRDKARAGLAQGAVDFRGGASAERGTPADGHDKAILGGALARHATRVLARAALPARHGS